MSLFMPELTSEIIVIASHVKIAINDRDIAQKANYAGVHGDFESHP